ncbi:DUF3726 domain-containing protein [Ancylobacter sp. 6x-1]|uniref:DUF3726 domain-containing protein n=1 Tax=Ancylobacter crimeensis TaxID=2579147 RepID=A0ABT0D8G2_9HYPH|nr:DUF3726 domain-containing protein [Ancylobacter crimeensis]MCK0196244.1 DUF3726 domain-containing protein [Ancylobacter crimeensis]
MIELSLNEVELQAAKAARGAGLSWGAAEDVGRAARWLARYGLDWAPALLALLDDPDAGSFVARICRLVDEGEMRGPAILSGRPLWMAALLAADIPPEGWQLDWQSAAQQRASLHLGPLDTLSRSGTPLPSGWTEGQAVTISTGGEPLAVRLPPASRSVVAHGAWVAIGELARKTYVPASARSRASGAGASLTDND